jgi:hypothetical protein
MSSSSASSSTSCSSSFGASIEASPRDGAVMTRSKARLGEYFRRWSKPEQPSEVREGVVLCRVPNEHSS